MVGFSSRQWDLPVVAYPEGSSQWFSLGFTVVCPSEHSFLSVGWGPFWFWRRLGIRRALGESPHPNKSGLPSERTLPLQDHPIMGSTLSATCPACLPWHAHPLPPQRLEGSARARTWGCPSQTSGSSVGRSMAGGESFATFAQYSLRENVKTSLSSSQGPSGCAVDIEHQDRRTRHFSSFAARSTARVEVVLFSSDSGRPLPWPLESSASGVSNNFGGSGTPRVDGDL
jgi:hypothetical protein